MVYKSNIRAIYSFQQQLVCDRILDALDIKRVAVWVPNPQDISKSKLISNSVQGKQRLGKQKSQKAVNLYSTIYCYDTISIDLICGVAKKEATQVTASKWWWQLLISGCLLARQRISSQLRSNPVCIDLKLMLDPQYVQRHCQWMNMSSYRFTYRVAAKEDLVAFTSVYFSVLGGAYSSLGKANHKYAYKAGTLAKRQIRLAKWLQDPILECKCRLYYAEDMIMQGRYSKAYRILKAQQNTAERLQNTMLMTMCDFVQLKWKTATSMSSTKSASFTDTGSSS